MTITAESPLTFKYFQLGNLGGRGGVLRFFMLSQGIQFEEELVNYDDKFAKEKQRMIETGENPCGNLPVVYSKDGPPASQHIASARYLARVHKTASGDDFKDYVQDLVADEYHGFRHQWFTYAFVSDEKAKAEYKTSGLPEQLTKFNSLYEKFKTDETFLSVSAKTGQPLWGDAAIYGLLRDHILTDALTVEDLAKYPCLSSMYSAYEKIPAVKEWCDSVNKK